MSLFFSKTRPVPSEAMSDAALRQRKRNPDVAEFKKFAIEFGALNQFAFSVHNLGAK